MLKEAVQLLQACPDGKVRIDATAGMGGHLREIIKQSSGRGIIFGIDRDTAALQLAKQNITDLLVEPSSNANSSQAIDTHSLNSHEYFRGQMLAQPLQTSVVTEAASGGKSAGVCKLLHGNFSDIEDLMLEQGISSIDGGILADIGVSSLQLNSPERGFSFSADGPLDMRMDTTRGSTAADIINSISESELADIIYTYGEERLSRRIAAKIVQSRPFTSTAQLSAVVASVVPRVHASKRGSVDKSHPATRTFQALRIYVNNELGALEKFLRNAIKLLDPGARIVVISFHSLEDRVVKQIFKEYASPCVCPPRYPICTCNKKQELKILTPKPLQPSEIEILANPRSRSAKLRAGERVKEL